MVTDRQLQEMRDAFSGCKQGDCKYPDPSVPAVFGRKPPVPPPTDHVPLCNGWWGTLYIEQREQVMRYRPCPRHDAWWAAERARMKAQKERERMAGKGEVTAMGERPR